MLDVLGHCFTDPLFQNLLRSPVRLLTAVDADDVLRTAEAEEEVKESPGGFTMKMLGVSQPECEGRLSCVMAGPEICLTTEEKSRLSELFNNQVTACKGCLPVRWVGKRFIIKSRLGFMSDYNVCSLFEIRVRSFTKTISMEEMLSVFSISRRAQNFWHYRTMCSMPGFDELSNR